MSEFKKVQEVPLQFRPDWYYHTIFYFAIPPSADHILGGNVMGLIWRLQDEPDCWRMTYRFRYYNSGALEDPKDTRSWYGFHETGKDAPAKFMQAIRMIHRLKACFGSTKPNEPEGFDSLLIDGDVEKVFEVLARENKPWLTMIKKRKDDPRYKDLVKDLPDVGKAFGKHFKIP